MYKNQVEVNISSVNCLPQDCDFSISHHILKRVQTKDQLYGVSTTVLYVLLYRRSIKSQWTVRNTKVHKGLVIEIM
jgi:hypothetical protein